MIQKLKYAGLLAILPLFMVSIAPDYISLADAATGAYVERSAITQKGDNSYEVVFQIYAGTEALPEGKLLVTSDVSSNEVLFRSVSAESLTSAQTKITADDPNSISAAIFTPTTSSVRIVTPQTDGVAYVELFTMNQEGDNAYDVVFKIYAGDEALSEGKLLVTSDVSSNEVLFRSVSAESLTSTMVRISADDPNSISAELAIIEPEIDEHNKFARKG